MGAPGADGALPTLRSNTSVPTEGEGSMGADQHSALGLFLRRCTLAFDALPFEVRPTGLERHPEPEAL